MLDSLRRWAAGWVAFFMIMLLILSFAIWGIADYIVGGSQTALATVGGEKINQDEFQNAFQNEVMALSQRAGQRISTEQARAVGLDQRVLQQLIGSAAVESHARQLGLALSDEAVAESLKRDPAFQGPDGKFSKQQLDGIMRQMGLSEAGLIALKRRDDLREHITSALLRGAVAPDVITDLMHTYRNETRVLSHVRIDPDKLLKMPEPTDADLTKTYEDNKSAFMTEPARHLAVLMLPLAELAKRAEITDDVIKTAYEQTRADYDAPEKRRIQQIPFKDKSVAEAALRELQSGKSFEDVAKAAGAVATDIDLGLLQKTQLIDPVVAEAAFKLTKDKVSEPIEGRFTTVLVRVTEIVPAKLSTFDDVKTIVKNKLAIEQARSQIQSMYTQVDDGRAAGTPLKQIGGDLKLPYFDAPAVTRSNKTANGTLILDVTDADRVVEAGFRGEVGLESEPISLSDGGYAWVDVVSVTEAVQKPFDQVKTEVKDNWLRQERRKQLSEIAGKLTQRLRDGEPLEKIADEVGGKIVTTAPVTRTAIPEGLNQTALSQAFLLPKGGFGHAETADGTSRSIFKVEEISPPSELDKEQRDALRRELREAIRADQIGQYVSALQDRLGVNIDRAVLERVMGGPQQ